jgi:hypothetical protein
MYDPFWNSFYQLQRRVTFLWYIHRYILDHETKSMASDHCDLRWVLNYQEELLSEYSSLETRHNNLTETRRYILDQESEVSDFTFQRTTGLAQSTALWKKSKSQSTPQTETISGQDEKQFSSEGTGVELRRLPRTRKLCAMGT